MAERRLTNKRNHLFLSGLASKSLQGVRKMKSHSPPSHAATFCIVFSIQKRNRFKCKGASCAQIGEQPRRLPLCVNMSETTAS